ncbi:MAG: response regulator [Gammaproteobacteria bacterium]
MSAYKILIADDEPYVARVLRLVLQKEGYEVTCVTNGKEALDVYHKWSPDMLVTDIKMPYMSGRELIETIRSSDIGTTMPVIVMTSTLESENRDWLGDADNMSFIGKPVSPRDLVRLINEHCPQLKAS